MEKRRARNKEKKGAIQRRSEQKRLKTREEANKTDFRTHY